MMVHELTNKGLEFLVGSTLGFILLGISGAMGSWRQRSGCHINQAEGPGSVVLKRKCATVSKDDARREK